MLNLPMKTINSFCVCGLRHFKHFFRMEGASQKTTKTRVTLLPTPVSAKSDQKEYRSIQLPNGLRCLLISDTRYPLDKLAEEEQMVEEDDDDEDDGEEGDSDDEDEDDEEEGEDEEDGDDDGKEVKKPSSSSSGLKQSAAGLCVGIGSFSDPTDLPGLAHFLEHMVFMGSEKYQDENSFDNFIQRTGGYDNASTDCETTVFYFETQRKHFREGLDRFSQFFIDPLMKQDAMERERQSIDSEFKIALTSDVNRLEQLMGSLAKDQHPMTKFMWGSLDSLKPEKISDETINKRLHDFKDRHYSSHNMTLVVQSQETLQTLQDWVEESFSSVPNNGRPKETFHHLSDPFETDKFNKIYKVAPIKSHYQLDLNWALPSLIDNYEVDPLHYMSWIIGHEGKGSLLSYLRKKVWALGLVAGNYGDGFEHNSTYSRFYISVTLTKDGFENLDQVLDAVFSYLKMMQTCGPNERIYKEIQDIQQVNFDFKAEKDPSTIVETLCENMHFYKPEHFITGSHLMFRYDVDILDKCTRKLTPEGVNVVIMAKEFQSRVDLVEPWFQTEYSVEDIPASYMKTWKNPTLVDKFYYPEINDFIAKDVSLKPFEGDADLIGPERIVEEECGQLFFKQDRKFLQPRAFYRFHIRSPLIVEKIENFVCLELMVRCMCQLMTEATYPAELAEINLLVYATDKGLILGASGLNDKLVALLQVALDDMAIFEDKLAEDQFVAIKDQYRKSRYNKIIKPGKLCKDLRLSILQTCYWTMMDCFNVAADITIDKMKEFASKFWKSSYLDGLVQGNVTTEEAKSAYNLIKSKLDLKVGEESQDVYCRQIPEGENVLRAKNMNHLDGNTIVINYYQYDSGTFRTQVLMEVIKTILKEPVFDILRTKEQLGYSVYLTDHNTLGALGISITVYTQASKHSPDYIDKRIEAFWQKALNEIFANRTEEEFTKILHTLIKEKKAADVSLSDEVDRHWGEIMEREYQFDRAASHIKILEESVTLEDVTDFLEDLMKDGRNFRKLSVQIVGNPNGNAQDNKQSEDIDNSHISIQYLTPAGDADSEVPFVKNCDDFSKDLPFFVENNITS